MWIFAIGFVIGWILVWFWQVLWAWKELVVLVLFTLFIAYWISVGFEIARYGTRESRLENVTLTPVRIYDGATREGDWRIEIIVDNQSDTIIDDVTGYCGGIHFVIYEPVPARTTATRWSHADDYSQMGPCRVDDADFIIPKAADDGRIVDRTPPPVDEFPDSDPWE
jgi:hypothetical protein